jgi:hypothetical protein
VAAADSWTLLPMHSESSHDLQLMDNREVQPTANGILFNDRLAE